jgi:hypothetical protein
VSDDTEEGEYPEPGAQPASDDGSAVAVDTAPAAHDDGVGSARRGLTVAAGLASLGSGAIHAAAIGVHAEHRPAAMAFTVLALCQLSWGALALVRAGRLVSLAGVAIGCASVGGWAVAKTVGIGFIEGLDVAEPAQTADAICAALALISVVLAVLSLLPIRLEANAPSLRVPALLTTMAVVLFTFAGMAAAGTHVHEHGEEGHSHAEGEAADGHSHSATETADGSGAAHSHGPAAAVAPEPYDPEGDINLGGVPGVTKVQQTTAESIVRSTIADLPQWADPATAEAAGYRSIHDTGTGFEHYINSEFQEDDAYLDPNRPESLVYQVEGDERVLVAAMYMEDRGMPLEDVPNFGGALMQWHVHDNLCYTEDGRVAGVTDGADGECPEGLFKPEPTPMIHVWITPHPCGPFAALEGIAGGTIPEGEEVLCDEAHGSTV